MAARPGLVRRCFTSSLTYSVPSQSVKMNTAMRNPAAALPCPPIRTGQPAPGNREGAGMVAEDRHQARDREPGKDHVLDHPHADLGSRGDPDAGDRYHQHDEAN